MVLFNFNKFLDGFHIVNFYFNKQNNKTLKKFMTFEFSKNLLKCRSFKLIPSKTPSRYQRVYLRNTQEKLLNTQFITHIPF